MNRRAVVAVVSLVFGIFGVALFSDGQSKAPPNKAAPNDPPESDQDKWMAIKLTSSQQILEHLTRGDFEQLEASARRMLVLNFLEQWQREVDPAHKSGYQGQLNAFEFATKELVRNAKDQNVEGALRAYVALTESCVRCHRLIRDIEKK